MPGLGRLYRTGDIARWRADGTLEFLGRRDDQIKLRGFRIEPAEIEAALISHPEVAQAAVILQADQHGRKRLVAYVVSAADQPGDADALRQHVAQSVPDYMVPSAFMRLPQLPLTSNGKLDRSRLPQPDVTPAAVRHVARTPSERILCALIGELLGQDLVGIDDNFFALGGDSIVSIQLVARARAKRLTISARDVFQHQTVEALAAVADAAATTTAMVPDNPVGRFTPTPIVHWLMRRGGPMERFVQAMLLQVPAALGEHHLLAALQAMLDHHHALRMRLVLPDDGSAPMGEIAAVGSLDAAAVARRVDITGLDAAAREAVIHAQAEHALARLSPVAGVMLQAVWFDAGALTSGRLLLLIHHLVVDGVSWRILLPDLAAAWQASVAGRQAALPPGGTSLRGWAEHLAADAQTPDRVAELPFWTTMLNAPASRLATGLLEPERDTVGTARQLTVTMPAAITRSVLTRVPAAFHGGVHDVLITALVLAIADWRRRGSGDPGNAVLVDLEGHGRDEFADVDLARTVGWLTSIYPVRLDLGAIDLDDVLAGGPSLGQALKVIKEQLRSVPQNGIGYGLLRYLNRQTAAQLACFAPPEIAFNYLGRFGTSEAADWASAPELAGLTASADPVMPLAHALEIDAVTLETPAGPELRANWSWAPALHSEDAVRTLAETWLAMLGALATHAAEPGAGGRTPSDFDLLTLSQAEIERLEREYIDLEDLLPLSPLQEGLLFHATYAAGAADVYLVQLAMELDGSLDRSALQAATGELFRRHAILRAGFRQDGFGRPVQVVVSDVALPWYGIDLTALDEAVRTERLAQIMAEDRARRFDVARPPLLRFTLIALAPERHLLVLTAHHIVLDGWSVPVLVQELLAMYAQGGSGTGLPRVAPYRDYLAWLARQDRAAAIAAWQQALAGLQEGTHIAPVRRGEPPMMPQELHVGLSESLTAALTRLARDHGLTMNTIVQGTWAILLGRLTGRDDVVFGITVAGRPPEIAGIERIVGLFINTVPLRVRLPAAQSMLDLFKSVQDSYANVGHQNIGLAEIQRVHGQGELFDTLVVFENYPLDQGSIDHPGSGLRLGRIDGRDATHYAVTVTATPGTCLALRFAYRPDLFDAAAVETLAGRLVRLLEAVAESADRPIAGPDIMQPAEQRALRAWNDTAHAIPSGTVLQLFAEQLRNNRDAAAVACGGESLSYAELDARSDQFGRYLQTLGIGPECVVGLCVQRSFGMVVGLLGILKAGSAYLPLDPNYPRQRLAYMVRNARATVLISEAGLAAALPQDVAKIVRIDADWPVVTQQQRPVREDRPHPARSGLYHLYVGIDRRPQGGRGDAWRVAQLRVLGDRIRIILRFVCWVAIDRRTKCATYGCRSCR